MAECPLICAQQANNSAATDANTCDPTTLTYSCICSNGLAPNASEYSQTLPYYICTAYNTQCQTACGNDNTCAAACVQDHPCGATNPTRVNTSTITTMSATSTKAGAAASTASDGVIYTGFGGGAAATTTAAAGGSGSSAAAKLAVNVGQIYGLGLLSACIFAGFSFML
jgi:poly-gamma-glutamate capsule biosynthesis protein CapA/YwtB (metallophosphatase superfamily)